jgi:uncharacterized membrane protein
MKEKSLKFLSVMIILLILLEIALCSWIILKSKNNEKVCIIGSSCEQVQDTQYGKILGVKLSILGLGAFIILLASLFINKKVFFWFSITGSFFAIYFILVQFFIIKQICSSCMLIDGLMILIGFLSYLTKNNKKDYSKI